MELRRSRVDRLPVQDTPYPETTARRKAAVQPPEKDYAKKLTGACAYTRRFKPHPGRGFGQHLDDVACPLLTTKTTIKGEIKEKVKTRVGPRNIK